MVRLEQALVIAKGLPEERVAQVRKVNALYYVKDVREGIVCAEEVAKYLVGVVKGGRR